MSEEQSVFLSLLTTEELFNEIKKRYPVVFLAVVSDINDDRFMTQAHGSTLVIKGLLSSVISHVEEGLKLRDLEDGEDWQTGNLEMEEDDDEEYNS